MRDSVPEPARSDQQFACLGATARRLSRPDVAGKLATPLRGESPMPVEPCPGSRSDFVPVRGLRYHVRRWGPDDAPRLFLLHGWMDVSATFDRVARRLAPRFQVLVPDWRGFGQTEWPQEGYWFQDYVADLDALVDHYQPDAPILLAGHSMGSQAASLFAGLRPKRVEKLAILDGLFLPDGDETTIVRRFRTWLAAVRNPPESPSYRSFEELAERVAKHHPRLAPEDSAFIARCWGREHEDGQVRLQSDPRHLFDMPRTYRQAESDAIWSCITAPTLFIDGGASTLSRSLPEGEVARRRAQFADRREMTLPDAGHMLHFDAPDALAAALGDFFGEARA